MQPCPSEFSSPPTKKPVATSMEVFRLRRAVELEGPTTLGDDELLALVLGRGKSEMSATHFCRELLDRVGGLALLSKLRTLGLTTIPGIGLGQAARLVAAFELGRRAEREAFRTRPTRALCTSQVLKWARPRLGSLDHEEVWVLCVDGRTTLRSTWQVARGGIHGCGLLARDILTPVVREAASGFVLVHNHPSGDPTPSPEDVDLTRSLAAAATAISVPLLDHVIVARGGGRSFFDLGLLP